MNLTHQAAFELMIEQERGAQLSDEQRLAVEQHLAGCADCRLEAMIVEKLGREATARWPLALEPAQGEEAMIGAIQKRFQRRQVFRNLLRPSPGLAWVAGAVLLVLLLSWVILNLVARQDGRPTGPAGPTQAATQAPQTTAAPDSSKTPVEPIFKAPSIGFGRPSPSGEYLYLLGDDPEELGRTFASAQLHFFEASSKKVCTIEELSFDQADARNGFAWLPDGRLLVVDADGEVLALPPCKPGEAERLTARFPEPVDRLYAPGAGGEAILVKGKEAYWLYEPASDQVRRIDAFRPGFIPGSDRIAWSPSGRRLAASIMNGATGQEGSHLYVLDLETLDTVAVLDLPGSENQSAPWVDWLAEDWLVLPDPEKALLVSLGGNEIKTIDLYGELFGLKSTQPMDFPSLDYQFDEEKNIFHLAVTSNMDGVHRIHLYHSEDGRVETLEQASDTLLILPNEEVLMAPYWEDEPTYRDEWKLIWVDSDRPPAWLAVEGHTPRQYPQMFPRLLPGERVAFSSSQGVSLYTYAEEVLRLGFWSLQEYQDSGMPDVILVEAAGGLLATADLWESGKPGAMRGLYFIPLP